ncbi:uncharacterized protein LODBEIA_P51940 [Lodderomyces beijingensis]|uniref:MAGE domain-containing protein n=1 Tax=Lodderomyces beijingensis TaxID=1775926 RepID=A0ABP0ZUW5_9ASCO
MARRKITLEEVERDEARAASLSQHRSKKRRTVPDEEEEIEIVGNATRAPSVDSNGSGGGGAGETGLAMRHDSNLSEADKQHEINQVVKLVLQKDLRGSFFRREYINSSLSNKRLRNEVLVSEACKVLQEVYGLTLVETPGIKVKSDNATANSGGGGSGRRAASASAASKKKHLALVSNLSKEARAVLGELWSRQVDSAVDKRKMNEAGFFIPRYHRNRSLPDSSHHLVKTGVLLLVITLIILNENHISEHQLVRNLRKFGISSGIDDKNSNYSLTVSELLKEFVQRENLLRKELGGGEKPSNEKDKMYEYSVGRRTLVEFTPQSIYDYISVIYGDSFTDTIAESTIVTIQRAYGTTLAQFGDDAATANNSLEDNSPGAAVSSGSDSEIELVS